MTVSSSTNDLANSATLSVQSTKSTTVTNSTLGSAGQVIPDLICFSHLRWNFVYQRPQHLLSRAAKNYRVWFLEEPMWSDTLHMSVSKQTDRITVLVPHLPHGTSPEEAIRLQRQLLDEFIARETIRSFVAWYYTPMAMLFSDHLQPSLTVYDCMDELSAFWGAPPQLLQKEKQLMQQADVVFTGGYSLYEAKQNRHPHVFAFPSSIDFTHFSSARKPQPDPVDQRQLATPRIGFSGVIDERFDYKLMGELAERRPDWQFVLLGPIVKIDPALLPHQPNVHYLGMKSYKDLPMYFSNWNVAMLPFALNESTRFISPTKTPEYLAAGLPVVSTPIRDVIRTYGSKELVEIADNAEAFEKSIERMLAKKSSNWQTVDSFLKENSWDHTWNEMNRLMMAQLSVVVDQ
ncbi:glycosyltransferase family 1 protein [Spirosoma fluviale]|uniref:Glycosyl transferases group 1 n=1 Tax=Spirosoma fluviale TaxID=1597977 RepID=A0A286F4D4_9BACT|nr:glycosyltransferase family 1 protein [Spirosoma fluviale]SOD78033.1 Glycosyl transferases group 1 [Spirosoma fluviale]